MNSYEENVRAILQCCFSQSKDEIIETAVKAIVALKQEPVVVNPISPSILPYQHFPPITTSPAIVPMSEITCEVKGNDTKKGYLHNF